MPAERDGVTEFLPVAPESGVRALRAALNGGVKHPARKASTNSNGTGIGMARRAKIAARCEVGDDDRLLPREGTGWRTSRALGRCR